MSGSVRQGFRPIGWAYKHTCVKLPHMQHFSKQAKLTTATALAAGSTCTGGICSRALL